MHIADIENGVLGANGLLAAGLALGTGAAFSAKYRGTDHVAVSFFGDGSSCEGEFHEAMNLASLWKLPQIFVCENNNYQVTVHMSQTCAIDSIAKRAAAYSMPSITVDGNDVLAVKAAAEEAVARARAGEGPTLIECLTTRVGGHYVGDQSLYVPGSIRKTWPERDCIENFSKKLVSEGIASAEEVDAVRQTEKQRLKDALDFARTSPYPDVSAAVQNVYSDFMEEGRNR
jgi:pyruvate dehydrogenase E1 component alpha subunit